MIVGLAEVRFEGSRLERLVLDRRFGQLILFLAEGDRGPVEVIYHRVDLETLVSAQLEQVSVSSPRIVESEIRQGDPLEHRLRFDSSDELTVRYQEARVSVPEVPMPEAPAPEGSGGRA